MRSKIIVTGGAGFIGSNLVKDFLLKNNEVHIFDNLSSGRYENMPIENEHLYFHKFDLKKDLKYWPSISADSIFHFAANADVKGGFKDHDIDFRENICVTKNICDYCKNNKIKKLIFSSSATVYGEPSIFPTPESVNLKQTSLYGASKLACESIIEAYCEYKFFSSCIFRFVSWTGIGYSHGVIYDFVKKLLKNKNELLILGDGKQRKSYLDVEDGIKGVINLSNKVNNGSKIFNLGHKETMNVIDLANIVCEEMNLDNVNYIFSGGERGWIGDSPFVHLDTSFANSMGWEAQISIENSIRRTVKYLLADPDRLFR